MSKTVQISSSSQFASLLSSSTVVVADFYADWCGPCKQIAPIYEQLSSQLSRPNKITFTKINTDQQTDLARSYGVTAMPTFMLFKNGQRIETVRGADPRKLSDVVKRLASEANKADEGGEGSSGGGSGKMWLGSELPKGYDDVTDQVDVMGLELLNWDSEFGNARSLIAAAKPKALSDPSAKSDHVESDTDEQLMCYIPFQSNLKVHSLYITSPPAASSTSRPKLIKLYINRPHILGFDEADDIQPTQEITLGAKSWDAKTHTARVELRFVKFQNVSSLIIYVVEAEETEDGESAERTRIDRIRIVGETGEKRDGKIEKIAHDD